MSLVENEGTNHDQQRLRILELQRRVQQSSHLGTMNTLLNELMQNSKVSIPTTWDFVDKIREHSFRDCGFEEVVCPIMQQGSSLQSSSRNLSREAREVLQKWLQDNADSPYPNEYEKVTLSLLTGTSYEQVKNWFVNTRARRYIIVPILFIFS